MVPARLSRWLGGVWNMPATMSKMQEALDVDVDRVDLAFLSVTVRTPAVTLRVEGLPDVQIYVRPDDSVMDTVQEAVGFEPERILLGGSRRV